MARARPYFIILLTVGIVFFKAVGYPFVTFDDAVHVYQNVHLAHFSWSGFARLFSSPFQGLYIPITYLAWAGQVLIGKLLWHHSMPDPALFHAFNCLLHLINAGLAFSIFKKLLGKSIPALIGALAFGLHPLQVETVAWISALKDLLSAAWGLVAIRLIMELQSGWTGRRRDCGIYLAASLLFVLALMSKPSAIMIPFLAGIVLWLMNALSLRERAIVFFPWLILSLPFMLLTKLAQPDFIIEHPVSLIFRPLVALDAVVFYFSKIIFPFSLTVNYGRVPDLIAGKWWVVHIWLVPLLAFSVLRKIPHRKYWLASIGLFVAYLIPVLGLVPFYFQRYSTVSDRFCYLGLMGVGLAAASVAFFNDKKWAHALLFLLVALLGFRSYDQLRHWSSDRAMLERVAEVNPHADIFYTLGVIEAEKKQWDRSAAYYLKAIGQDRSHYASLNNLALVLMEQGRMKEGEFFLRQALEVSPASAEVLNNMGTVLLSSGEIKQAEKYFLEAIRLGDNRGKANLNLGLVREKQRRWDDAIRYFKESIRLNPAEFRTHSYLAAMYVKTGDRGEALKCYRQLISKFPKMAENAIKLGEILVLTHDYEEAKRIFGEALRMASRRAGAAHQSLGRMN